MAVLQHVRTQLARLRGLYELAMPPPEQHPPMPAALAVYGATIGLIGAAVMVAAARSLGPGSLGPEPVLFWVLFALYVVAEAVPMPLISERGGLTYTVSWVFICALILATPGWATVVVVPLVLVVLGAVERARPLMTALNLGTIALTVAAGIAVLELGGQRAALLAGEPGLVFVAWMLLSASVMIALNFVLFQLGTLIEVGGPLLTPAMRMSLRSTAMDAALVPLAPILVVVGQRSLALLPLLLVSAIVAGRSAWVAILRHHEAGHDTLTGLANRRSFSAQAAQVLQTAPGTPVALAILDLDGFKAINDRLGHQIGDEVLRALAARLRQRLRPSDLVARLGGDEFAFLSSSPGGLEEAEVLAGRVLDAIREPVTVGGFPLTVDGSIGVACSPDHGTDLETLTRHADLAMYRAKRGNGGLVMHSEDAGEAEVGRLSLLADLPAAMADGRLFAMYQPVIDVASGRVAGGESLLRWQHPQLGLVMPDEFLPLAEHTDLIGELTRLVLDDAIAQCAAWRAAGLNLCVGVHVSARNLADREFAGVVAERLERFGVPGELLVLEITESTVMADPERCEAVLAELRAMGVWASIDGFGTGYSSLARLRRLQVQGLKIDRSFVRDLREGDATMVRSVLELARGLGLRTCAGGVEDPAVYERLAELGCDFVQGDLFSPPVSGDRLTELARASYPPSRPVPASA